MRARTTPHLLHGHPLDLATLARRAVAAEDDVLTGLQCSRFGGAGDGGAE
jgi:hypothetical protein